MKKLLLLLCVVMLGSCRSSVVLETFYQVYNVQSDNLIKEDGCLKFSNEDCDILYNFWSEGGDPGFIVYNKTDKDIFINLSRTFFIKNSVANDYYKNREYSYSGTSNSYPYLNESKSSTVTYKEKPVICIPPKSSRSIQEYNISSDLIQKYSPEVDFPKNSSTVFTYFINNSPIIFSNRIMYSHDPQFTSSKFIENIFWISEVVNYSTDRFKEIDLLSPFKFYNTYSRETLSEQKQKEKKLNDGVYY